MKNIVKYVIVGMMRDLVYTKNLEEINMICELCGDFSLDAIRRDNWNEKIICADCNGTRTLEEYGAIWVDKKIINSIREPSPVEREDKPLSCRGCDNSTQRRLDEGL